jgi:hypothetical protein
MVQDWVGNSCKVPIADDKTYVPMKFSSGGALPAMEPTTVQATLTPISWGIAVSIGNDLIEDLSYDIVEWHLRQAAVAFGRKATDEALLVLKTATDGVGTVNSAATGDADETKYTGGATSDILVAWAAVGEDEHIADTLVCTPEAWEHSIGQSTTAATMDGVAPVQLDERFNMKLSTLNLDVVFSCSEQLHDSADAAGAAFTECVSLIFDRDHALFTGRKRWLQINEYSDPVSDLAGAVIVGEQDSVTLYDDSIYILTET